MTASIALHESIEHSTGSDLSILGNGFFVVRDPKSRQYFATQSGHFSLDANGYLVTENGARAQGCTDASLTVVGDMQINIENFPTPDHPSTIPHYTVDEDGKILVQLSGGASCLCGQIMLQNFEDPRALVSEGGELYSNLSDAGPLPALAAPGSNGLGYIHGGNPQFSHPSPWNN